MSLLKRHMDLYRQECSSCHEIKTYTKFRKHRCLLGGHQSECKQCRINKTDKFSNLTREINPETGKPYKRGEIKNGKYVFSLKSKRSLNIDWDKPYIPVQTLSLDKFIVAYAKATISRRNQYVKTGRLKSHKLTFEHLVEIFPKDLACPVFGNEMTFVRGKPNSVELDRVDRRYEYADGNVAWISAKANRCKGDATSEELLSIAAWLESKGC